MHIFRCVGYFMSYRLRRFSCFFSDNDGSLPGFFSGHICSLARFAGDAIRICRVLIGVLV